MVDLRARVAERSNDPGGGHGDSAGGVTQALTGIKGQDPARYGAMCGTIRDALLLYVVEHRC